jgi:Asp-tRNA(Asn)/Glu-tRNA(Gln) amidotransferase A subunit family amidase
MKGLLATMGGAEQIVPTIGPLSTSLEGCKIFTKTIVDAKPWLKEPSLLPFPWKTENFFPAGRKLKVAVLWDDGVVKPHPPVTRALKQIIDKLKSSNNVEVVEWKPFKHDLAWEIIVGPVFLPQNTHLTSSFRQIYTSPTAAQKKRPRLNLLASHGDRFPNTSLQKIPISNLTPSPLCGPQP